MFSAEERLKKGGFIPPWVRAEHEARYEFALPFVKEKMVVDCACGSGIGSRLYAEAGAKEVRAFDNDVGVIARNKKNNDLPNLDFFVADALSLPLENHSADVFISFETIEHLDDDRGFLAEISRILRPDGIFICSTPNRQITNPRAKINDRPWNKFHKREYAPAELNALLGGFFSKVDWYGQGHAGLIHRHFFDFTAKTAGRMLAVRLRQIGKLLRFFFDKFASRAVLPVTDVKELGAYEYLIAIGRI